jgi:hypothetical protein
MGRMWERLKGVFGKFMGTIVLSIAFESRPLRQEIPLPRIDAVFSQTSGHLHSLRPLLFVRLHARGNWDLHASLTVMP